MATCASRIKTAMAIRGLKQKDLVEMTGIPKSAISQYCSGSFCPKQTRLHLLANALQVDEAWLMGLNVPMESSSSEAKADDIADIVLKLKENDHYRSTVKVLYHLADDQLDTVRLMLFGLLQQSENDQN